MKGFIKFMTNISGRIIRILIGLFLIAWGIYFSAITPNWILIIIGIIPFSAGIFNFCLVAPLFGYSLNGDKARHQVDVSNKS